MRHDRSHRLRQTDSPVSIGPLPARKGKTFLVFTNLLRCLTSLTSHWQCVILPQAVHLQSILWRVVDHVTFPISWSVQDPLSFHGDTAESATHGRICLYPFGDVGDKDLLFREYLVFQVGLSLEVVVRNLNLPCDDLCEIPRFQVTPIPSRPPLKYHAQLIHVPIDFNPPDSCPLSILSCLSTMSFPSKNVSAARVGPLPWHAPSPFGTVTPVSRSSH